MRGINSGVILDRGSGRKEERWKCTKRPWSNTADANSALGTQDQRQDATSAICSRRKETSATATSCGSSATKKTKSSCNQREEPEEDKTRDHSNIARSPLDGT